ncbi:MAG: ATP-binding protein [Bacteroidales bacterium]
MPIKALREAIVNALMHRSYRVHRLIQVIRYDNRIEIINPGYSLKSEELLGEPKTRNPFIAALFYVKNLAETKGSGIRAMRRLMTASHLTTPTFSSNRNDNHFVSRLLLHHFLDEKDIEWLKLFDKYKLNDNQKQALVFIREIGAIDNLTFRQMGNSDTLKASIELKTLKAHRLIVSEGKGKATYYIPNDDLSAYGRALTPFIVNKELKEKIGQLKNREHNHDKVKDIVRELCKDDCVNAGTISKLLKKGEVYVRRKFLTPMIKNKELVYLSPEMIKHPYQANKSAKK